MRKFVEWLKWEFDRTIEVTPVIRLVTIERFLKAFVLIVGGVVLIVLSAKTDLHRFTENLQDQLNLQPGRSWWQDMYARAVVHLGAMSKTKENAVAVGAILYGGLEAFEGIGLLRRKRWAEYLVLIATAAFLPLEITEIIKKVSVLRVLALVVNLLIIGYLIYRKRLFLERPGHVRADDTTPVPADLA